MMSGTLGEDQGDKVGGRARNPTVRTVVVVALVVGVASALVFAIPSVHFGYPFPLMANTVATIVSASSFVLAILFYVRHARTRSPRDVVLCVAFGFVTGLELVLPLVAEVTPTLETLALWSRIFGRLAFGVAVCIAAWLPERTMQRRMSPPIVATIASTVTLLVVGFIVLRLGSFPSAISGAFDGPADSALISNQTGGYFRIVGAGLFTAAAIGFARTRVNRPQEGMAGWLALAAVILSAARVHDFLWPSRYYDWLLTGDTLRAVALVVLVYGAVTELVVYWHRRVAKASAEERRRLARELHDGLAQELAHLTTNFALLAEDLEAHDPLHGLVESAERALIETRTAIAALSDGERLRLDRLLADVSRRLEERHGYPVVLDLTEVEIDKRTGHELTRIAQEALANAARHARPRRIQVRLRGSRHTVRLSVTDDGRGLDLPALPTHGFGLRSMRERVEGLGGTCSIGPAPRGGTQVLVEVPRS